MPSSLPVHPRVPRGRSRLGASELLIIQRATLLIDDLGAELDEQLRTESRATERLRMLRATTNRITRTANDAVRAYARANPALKATIARDGGDVEDAVAMLARLHAARLDLLRALSEAGRRYPPAKRPPASELEQGVAARP